jgi:hypothetical protein
MTVNAQRSLRLIPKTDFSRLTGNRGELFYDPVNNTLRVFNGQTLGGEIIASRTWVTTQLPSIAGLATETYVNQAVAVIPQYLLKITADDSTVLAVGRDETLQVRGQGSITTSISTDSTGIQLVITGPQVSNTDINVNAQFGSASVVPTERVVKSYADLLFNLQTQQLQNGTLTITAAGLVFAAGVAIDEFSNDPTFADNSSSAVPTEAAVRSYIDRRLGLTHNGDVVSEINKIGPTYLTTDGLNNVTLTGFTTIEETTEVVTGLSGATGTVAHSLSSSAIFYHTTPAANFTANFTNVPTTNNRTIVVTLILVQGETAYIPNAVQIDGAAQTVKWLGSASAPTGNADKVDIVSFTLVRVGSAWAQVLGSLTSFG